MEIRNRWTNEVIWSGEAATVKEAVEKCVKAGVPLSGANLYGADLSKANLSGANLSGADLYGANLSGAYLTGANLYGADLSKANLSGADLYGADLSKANLSVANLSGADLTGADLTGANLYKANLSGAMGLTLERISPLAMLLDQPGPIRAYKLVNEKSEGPFNGGIKYELGQTYEEPNANTDPNEQCAKGLNVASLDWCMKEWRAGYRILLVEFEARDIAVIPLGTDGKFRVRKMAVVGEKDLKVLGLEK